MMRLANVSDSTGKALHDLADVIKARIVERGKHATGMAEFLTTATTSNDGKVVLGLAYGPSYFPWLGSGRGAGKAPPIDALAAWAKAKGLTSDDKEARSIGYLISRKIAREGSKDKRDGKANIYEQAIDEFVNAGKLDAAQSAEQDLAQFVDETFKNIKANG